MKAPVIYKIRNVVNQKFYVGSTTDTRERFRVHRNRLRRGAHHCPHLQAAWNKYGEDCFKFEIVETVPTTEELFTAEDRWLDAHFGKPYCYNAGRSAEAPMRGRSGKLHPNYGKVWGPEFRAKISEAAKRQWASADPRTGFIHSDETKAKISAKVQAALAEGRGGKFIPTEETRRKMSEALKGNQCAKGYKRTVAEREAIRQRTLGNTNWLGKRHSEESIALMSRAVRAVTPEGVEHEFIGLNTMSRAVGVHLPTLIRACKTGKPVRSGKLAGWVLSYADAPQNQPPEIPPEFAHLPRTRQLAIKQGAKFYFTGSPCSKGHLAPRHRKGGCTECLKEQHNADNAKRNDKLVYSHYSRTNTSLGIIYTDAPEASNSRWPAVLEYRGVRWGRYELHTDVFRLPEDLECAIEQMFRAGKKNTSLCAGFWDSVVDSFPPNVETALRSIWTKICGA